MAYNPTTWQTGDTITATAMNKIENGIANAGSALVVQATIAEGQITCNKTVQEIYNAMTSGTPVYIAWAYGTLGVDFTSHTYFAPVVKIYSYSTTDIIYICASVATTANVSNIAYPQTSAIAMFSATSMNGYPVYYKTIYPQTSDAHNSIG